MVRKLRNSHTTETGSVVNKRWLHIVGLLMSGINFVSNIIKFSAIVLYYVELN